MQHFISMNYADLPERLARIVNLKQFSDRSKIPRRTLYTVMNRTNSPSLATCERIEKKLKEIKPPMVPRQKVAA